MKIDLKDTVNLMLSENRTERMQAEYLQLIIRKKKLQSYLYGIKEGKIPPVDQPTYKKLWDQLKAMRGYQKALEEKAALMKIDLKAPLKKEE